jgi:ABC-type sulfate/molybdate transport systems ATPase subunit
MVIVTHDRLQLERLARRCLRLSDGHLEPIELHTPVM